MVRSPGFEPGPDPWQGSIIAPRQRAQSKLTALEGVKKITKQEGILQLLRNSAILNAL